MLTKSLLSLLSPSGQAARLSTLANMAASTSVTTWKPRHKRSQCWRVVAGRGGTLAMAALAVTTTRTRQPDSRAAEAASTARDDTNTSIRLSRRQHRFK